MEWIAGLIGVIVGALITGGVEVWREWRRDQQQQRMAARRISDEVSWANVSSTISVPGVHQATNLHISFAWDAHYRASVSTDPCV
jgi:hypothetical protein